MTCKGVNARIELVGALLVLVLFATSAEKTDEELIETLTDDGEILNMSDQPLNQYLLFFFLIIIIQWNQPAVLHL